MRLRRRGYGRYRDKLLQFALLTYAGLPGPLTIVNAISSKYPSSFIGETIGCGIALIGAFLLVQIIGFADPPEKEKVETKPSKKENISEKDFTKVLESADKIENILSPIDGEVVALSDVPDDVFSTGVLGKGVAIEPKVGKVFAPFDGTVINIVDSKHAIGLRSENGTELLIHVGLDTVQLEGRYFDLKTKVDANVKAGDVLLEFDAEAIKKAGYSLVTPVVVTNSDEYADVLPYPKENAKHGEKLVAVIK